MCYEIFLSWIALTPIFMVISVYRASRTSDAGFFSAIVESMIQLYGLSMYATLLTVAVFTFAMIPVFICILFLSKFGEVNVDHLFHLITVLAIGIWGGAHLYLGYNIFRDPHESQESGNA